MKKIIPTLSDINAWKLIENNLAREHKCRAGKGTAAERESSGYPQRTLDSHPDFWHSLFLFPGALGSAKQPPPTWVLLSN